MDVGTRSPLPTSPPDPSAPLQAAGAPTIKRRAPIACRRCRRMRSKCLHDKARPPCQACLEAGLGPADCVFPVRGEPDHDREYRHPRVRADKSKREPNKLRRNGSDDSSVRISGLPSPVDGIPMNEWDLLPPLPDVIEAVNIFTQHYFQLGFIPKQAFEERLKTNPQSVSVFLLLGILSVSARFTPSLIRNSDGGVKAAELFVTRASEFALHEVFKKPNLERCQGFYLLSISQQGYGMNSQSSINMAIAVRMATLMSLHREETYAASPKTRELITRAESARRTLWMLHSQDNLHSGPASPVSLSASDITTLLPCNEEDFANGVEPPSRAALQDTPPALQNPNLITDKCRSLFASLVQSHYLWGVVSRRAVSGGKSSYPWEPESGYAKIASRLKEWEDALPASHKWHPQLLKKYKASGEDLAYLGLVMIIRLANIVLRKAYLNEIIACATGKSVPAMQQYWINMSRDLFENVRQLYEPIDKHFQEKTSEDGKAVLMTAFNVYSCGTLACYLLHYPYICPDSSITEQGPVMLQRCVRILEECQHLWPLASRWLEGLKKFRDMKPSSPANAEGSMADESDPIPHVLHPSIAQPPIKPMIQPRIPLPPHREDKHSLQPSGPHPHTPILPVPQPEQPQVSYMEPNLRLPVPQPHATITMPPPAITLPQQTPQLRHLEPQPLHEQLPHNQQYHHHHDLSNRPSTDAINLLVDPLSARGAATPSISTSTSTTAMGHVPPNEDILTLSHVLPYTQEGAGGVVNMLDNYYIPGPLSAHALPIDDSYDTNLRLLVANGNHVPEQPWHPWGATYE
ncbi:hypothetical protein VTK73DRAFT_8953 [Phialemonium thermophilum]|uniref:Zn(2)-C6 fungal-type domain-containing protein n=1 Tax=Phialemonium thermophilum TaxID=223376 RepID=A0ABR3Y519_9PEZI